ncbi:hypothetical protein ABID58_007239 [Bradyrhizobium sp. S3.2.6]|uniref:hypothetical protein n=1 Tax=Bradyrhizobium sp. S3.2.6 TaxID=3156428 RepID=UPI0033970B76
MMELDPSRNAPRPETQAAAYRRAAAFAIPKTPATLDYLPEDRAKAPISYDIP